MAESIVTLRVEARNAISSLNKTSQATRSLSRNASGATKSLAATSTAARGLGAALASSLGPLLTVGAAVATVSNAIGTFTARERDVAILTQGLKNLGAGATELNELQKAADRLGNQTLFNQEEFTRGFNLLTSFRNIGVDAYSRVAQAAADIAQVNQVDVNTSFMQLAKALQDPERNLSNLNRSGIAFTKQQTEVIKELMKTNKTAEAHAMILGIVEESYNKLSQAAAEGFAGNVDSLGEAFRDFSETLGKALEPALIAVTKGLTSLIKAADELLKSPLGKTAAIFTAIALAAKGIVIIIPVVTSGLIALAAAGGLATVALNALPFVAIATAAGAFITAIIKATQSQRDFNKALKEGDEQALKSEFNRLFIERQKLLQRLAKAQENNNKRAINSLQRQLNINQASIKPIKEQMDLQREAANNIVATKTIENKLDDDKAKKFADFLKKQETQRELLQSNLDGNRQEVELQQAINAAVDIHGEKNRQKITDILTANAGLKNQKKDVDAITEAAEKQGDIFKQIGDTIASGISDALVGAILHTKSLGEAAKGILNDIASQLLRLGINTALNAIFPGSIFANLPTFAAGGRPPVGRASIVGEKGPELFVPSSAGTIIPNNQIGGGVTNNIVVNVDASGSNVEGNEQQSRELGLVLSTAIQAEIVQQKRPGGLLA